jgi:hypothetical protein
MMSNRYALAQAGLCAVLAGTAVASAPATLPAPLPSPAQLAALAFPGWSDSPAGRTQPMSIAAGPGMGRDGDASWAASATRVLVEPKLVLRTDATHLTLIAGMVPAGGDGTPHASHPTPLALAAYQFDLRGSAWSLARQQGVFAMRGFFGAATVRAVALSNQRQAVAVEYGSCWQGYCGTWLSLYEVDGGKMRTQPAVELSLSGNNDNAAFDCERRLQPLIKHKHDHGPHDDSEKPDRHDCYVIEGSWTIDPARDAARGEPGDMVIHYQGAMSRAGAHTAPPVAIDQRQVLRYAGARYRAIAGFDPVPPI